MLDMAGVQMAPVTINPRVDDKFERDHARKYYLYLDACTRGGQYRPQHPG
jgi:hypothetical protein